ncbi:MAG: Gfo/Idh/MocA family oxidoreductase [Sedimentisphaerales bacterium]|nr:Gfo/Idh/MocA family oxidoreductase [Sedimentisphaerales bacterium]
MKTWNFGIVGAGLIADFHARAIGDVPNAKLIGFCDVARERAEALAEKYGGEAWGSYEEMLSDERIDIVTIATPSGLHLEPAVAAAEAGKHVICEKPLEITLERIDAMIEAHERCGTKLAGVFQNRFNDLMVVLREAVEAKRFGRITYAAAAVPWWREEAYYKGTWHGDWKLDGGGALMNQSIHMIDMLCDLMGPVESVQGFTARLGHENMEAEDTAVAVLRFADGALGSVYGTTASYPGQYKRFELTGTKGTAVVVEEGFAMWQFAQERAEDEQIRKRFGQVGGGGGVADPAAISYVNHTRNFQAFLAALEEGREFELNGAEARKAVELILAIYEAAREQKLVRLD